MCVIYTSHISYQGADGLDITVKSATGIGRVLAPTWAIVLGVKHWRGYEALTPDQYSRQYYALLRERFQADRQPFLDLLERERLVLKCYCQPGMFCHRHLAADILEKIGQANGLYVVRGCELPVSGSSEKRA